MSDWVHKPPVEIVLNSSKRKDGEIIIMPLFSESLIMHYSNINIILTKWQFNASIMVWPRPIPIEFHDRPPELVFLSYNNWPDKTCHFRVNNRGIVCQFDWITSWNRVNVKCTHQAQQCDIQSSTLALLPHLVLCTQNCNITKAYATENDLWTAHTNQSCEGSKSGTTTTS